MFNVVFIDRADNRRVTKTFSSFDAARTFYFRCKHSKRVVLASCNFDPYK